MAGLDLLTRSPRHLKGWLQTWPACSEAYQLLPKGLCLPRLKAPLFSGCGWQMKSKKMTVTGLGLHVL